MPVLYNIHDVQLALKPATASSYRTVTKFDGPAEGMRKQDLDEIYAMEVL